MFKSTYDENGKIVYEVFCNKCGVELCEDPLDWIDVHSELDLNEWHYISDDTHHCPKCHLGGNKVGEETIAEAKKYTQNEINKMMAEHKERYYRELAKIEEDYHRDVSKRDDAIEQLNHENALLIETVAILAKK